nr:hypothetical protein Iba_chr15fCG5890 [Ipomoea batatas]
MEHQKGNTDPFSDGVQLPVCLFLEASSPGEVPLCTALPSGDVDHTFGGGEVAIRVVPGRDGPVESSVIRCIPLPDWLQSNNKVPNIKDKSIVSHGHMHMLLHGYLLLSSLPWEFSNASRHCTKTIPNSPNCNPCNNSYRSPSFTASTHKFTSKLSITQRSYLEQSLKPGPASCLQYARLGSFQSCHLTQAAQMTLPRSSFQKGTHFIEPDVPSRSLRPFKSYAKNHLNPDPNGPTMAANHNWDSLLPSFKLHWPPALYTCSIVRQPE